MKILLLADPGSIHTIRWALSLSSRGLDISIFGLNAYSSADYEKTDVKVYSARIKPNSFFSKLRYLTSIVELRKTINKIKPDIIHAHYASSYGLLGKLSGFRPLVTSVWGSDVYDFPRQSPLHKLILKINLRAADQILSTSHAMAAETLKYAPGRSIEVTPFGIDLEAFYPANTNTQDELIRIGTIKALNAKYGIGILIRAFAIVKNKSLLPLKLIIAGDGMEERRLKELTTELHIADSVEFLGKIPHQKVPELLNTFTIFCALSVDDSESFGVAAVEASACEIPVVVSDAAGLGEVVKNGVTGIVVPKKDPVSAATAIETLLANKDLREAMGKAGRIRVKQLYEWKNNVAHMVYIYTELNRKK